MKHVYLSIYPEEEYLECKRECNVEALSHQGDLSRLFKFARKRQSNLSQY
jgi:hypothetical protein